MFTPFIFGQGFGRAKSYLSLFGAVLNARVVVLFCGILSFSSFLQAQDARVEKALIREKLKYETTESGRYKLVYETSEGRSQLVFVNAKTQQLGKFEVREVWSPIYISSSNIPAKSALQLLEANSGYKVGAWELTSSDGQYMVSFSVKVPADLDSGMLASVLSAVASTADEVEKQLTEEDKY